MYDPAMLRHATVLLLIGAALAGAAGCGTAEGKRIEEQVLIKVVLPAPAGGETLSRKLTVARGTTVLEATRLAWPDMLEGIEGGRVGAYLRMMLSLDRNEPYGTGWWFTVDGDAPQDGPRYVPIESNSTVVWQYGGIRG